MAMTKAALAAEITNDPAALGYAALKAANNDQGLADLLNDMTKGGTLTKTKVSASELQSCVVASEYATRSANQINLWNAILIAAGDGSGVATGNSNIVGQAQAVWNPSTTMNNLSALRTRACSRAEALWGEGAAVSAADVSNAIR